MPQLFLEIVGSSYHIRTIWRHLSNQSAIHPVNSIDCGVKSFVKIPIHLIGYCLCFLPFSIAFQLFSFTNIPAAAAFFQSWTKCSLSIYWVCAVVWLSQFSALQWTHRIETKLSQDCMPIHRQPFIELLFRQWNRWKRLPAAIGLKLLTYN